MIELNYYKMSPEDKKYKTWFYDKGNVYLNPWYAGSKIGNGTPVIYVKEDDVNFQRVLGGYENGWTKAKMPDDLTKEEQLDWYIASNEEDLHFIMKEREACFEWFTENMDEILLAQKHNKKIKAA